MSARSGGGAALPVRDRKVIVVSPHLDDAAFSAWWVLANAQDVRVVTVCTAPSADDAPSDWDRRQGFRTSTEAIAARIAEDRAAFSTTSATSTHLGLLDAAYRSDGATGGDADRRFVDDVVSTLSPLLSNDRMLVLLPAALGRPHHPIERWRSHRSMPVLRRAAGAPQHPDHRLVRDALMAHLRPMSADLAFYADFPYVRSGGQRQFRRDAHLAGWSVRPVRVPIDLAAKEAMVRQYGSQLVEFEPAWARRFSQVMAPRELYWSATRTPGTVSSSG